MRRLYFLLPDVEVCKVVVAELEEKGVPERHLHAVARLEQRLEGIPEAGVMQKTELKRGLEWGILLGGVAGLLGGWLTITFPPPGVQVGVGALLLTAALGMVFGALVVALLSSQQHNRVLDKFERAIETGEILLMVDVPRQRVKEIKALILEHHPGAEIGVVRPKL